MNPILFSVALLMTVVAMGFATKPLIVSYERRSSGSAKLSLLGIIVVFGMGVVLYGVIGNPELGNIQATSSDTGANTRSVQPSGQSNKVGSVTSLLSGLEARLAENPDDAKGWLLLAQSYDHLGHAADARSAYAKATALGMTDSDLEARFNESAGAASSASAEIRGRVSVAETVADRVDPGDTVYIIARANSNPAPLAVLRRSAAELPFDFVLSDDNSMFQGAGIASAGTLTISARLSKTGDALNTATQLGTNSAAVDPQDAGVLALVIDAVPRN